MLAGFSAAEGLLSIRPLAPGDGRHLHRWLNDPAVLAFYDGRDTPGTWERIREHYLSKTGYPEQGCLVEWQHAPAGFLQVYPLEPGDAARFGFPAAQKSVGMDMFLGETSLWGHGIGTQLTRVASDALLDHWGADRVVLDPRVANTRAVHVYQKSGFVIIKRLIHSEYHEGVWEDCWLMERRRRL